jgi:hypothetical protein
VERDLQRQKHFQQRVWTEAGMHTDFSDKQYKNVHILITGKREFRSTMRSVSDQQACFFNELPQHSSSRISIDAGLHIDVSEQQTENASLSIRLNL